jgi:hypothetical protein
MRLTVLVTALCMFSCGSSAEADQSLEDIHKELQTLRAKTEELQRRLDELQHAQQTRGTPVAESVDLSSQQLSSIAAIDDNHVLSRPWWQNFAISGFAAVGMYDTGHAGTRGQGGFEIKETSLFVEADVWRDTSVFFELQVNRLGADDAKYTRTGEVYLHFRDAFRVGDSIVGLKVGRIDIPFGEDYLTQDAIDNPLITTSAAYPYGWDEGLLLHGGDERFGWIFSVTDGNDTRSLDDNSDKAINVKFSGRPITNLYTSLSLMRNGQSGESALEFGGSHLEPVGSSHRSTLGRSPSARVRADLAALDFKLDLARDSYLAVSVGAARIADPIDAFDRNLRWFSIEPYIRIKPEWYLVARYSQIGTTDDLQGYHFDGKTFAGGNSAFGFDATEFARMAVGIGWHPNSRLRGKLEFGRDRFALIENSPFSPDNSNREFVGLEMAASF